MTSVVMHRNLTPSDFSYKQHYTDLCDKSTTADLFVDEEFQPYKQAFSWVPLKKDDVTWKRPHEIISNPVLFSQKPETKTFKVGIISNQNLISACLLLRREIMPRIMPELPEIQNWPQEYKGIFRYRFWRINQWIEVVIDDLLPVYKENGERLFSHSDSHREEFAIALLEKALAKFYGGYKVLRWMKDLAETMEDLTGGIPERIPLNQYRFDVKAANYHNLEQMYNTMFCNYYNKDPIGCLISAQTPEITSLGLVARPSIYTLSGLCVIPVDSAVYNRPVQMLFRLRNVWSIATHTDKVCPIWQNLSTEEKEKYSLQVTHANDMWITLEDFINYFDVIQCCHIVDNIDQVWCERSVLATWTDNPMRCAALEDFNCLQNPQFYFDVYEIYAMVHIQLTRTLEYFWQDGHGYGFILLKVEPNREHRVQDINIFSKRFKIIETNLPYVEKKDPQGNIMRVRKFNRSARMSFFLERGRYVLIPATVEGYSQSNFVLRVATHNRRTQLDLLQEPSKKLKMFTKFEFNEVSGLDMKDVPKESPIFVECSCERKKFAFTRLQGSKLWESVIFPRTAPKKKPVTIKILSLKADTGEANELAKFEWKSQQAYGLQEQELNPCQGQKGKLLLKVSQSKDISKM